MTAGAEAITARRAERESAKVANVTAAAGQGTLRTHVSRVKPVLLESRADAKRTQDAPAAGTAPVCPTLSNPLPY